MDIEKIGRALDAGYTEAQVLDQLAKQDPTLAPKLSKAREAKYGDAEILRTLTGGRAIPRARTATTVSEPAAPAPRTTELVSKPATPVEAVGQKLFESPFGEAGSFLGRLLPAVGAAVTPGGPGFKETYAARRRAQEQALASGPPPVEIKTPGARVAGELAGGLAELGSLYGGGGLLKRAPGVAGKVGEFITATPMTDLASTVLGSTVTGVTDKPLLGAVTGAATGLSLPTIGHFKNLWFKPDVSLTEAERELKRGLAERLRARGEDPERIAKEIEALGPNTTMADVSPALRGFFEDMIGRPAGQKYKTSGQERVADLLAGRLDPAAMKGELVTAIDPGKRREIASVTKAAAESKAAAAEAAPTSIIEQASKRAREFFGGRQSMRGQVIQNEIGATLKPIKNVEQQLDTWASTRKELNDQARESFLMNPLDNQQRGSFDRLLQENKPVADFYEKFINELRGIKQFEPLLPVDPREARGVIARFNKATEGMTDEQRKQAEKVFLSDAEKKRFGSMDGVRDEATGTKNLSTDLADRIRQWTNESAARGFDSNAVDAASRKAMAEGQSIARAQLDEILRRGGEKTREYNEWLGRLADIRQKEEAVDVGRKIAGGDVPADRVPILLRDMPPETVEAVKDGFVDAYARMYRTGDPSSTAVKAAQNKETQAAMAALFGKDAADKMFATLSKQAEAFTGERTILSPGLKPETVVERAKASAPEWGGESFYQRLEAAKTGGEEAKRVAEAVERGRKALNEGEPLGDIVKYTASLPPEAKAAFVDGFIENIARDPQKYAKAALEQKGDIYAKLVSGLGQETVDRMTEIARRQQTFGRTGKRYENLMEGKPAVTEPGMVDEMVDAAVSGLQAKVGFVGRGADYLKRAFVRPDPIKFPTVRQTGADILMRSPQEQADYVRSLLNYRPEGVFKQLSERVLAPTVKGAVIPGTRVFQPPEYKPSLPAEELARGERPL